MADHDDHDVQDVTYVELARFYLPLAFLPFLVHITKVIANAAIARLPQAEAVFAAYSVARSLLEPIASPMWMTRQTSVALIDSAASYLTVRKVIAGIALTIGTVLVGIAYTPAGPWLLEHVMGIDDEVILYHAVWTLRIVALLPLAEALRNLPQAVTISLERTEVVPVGTILRVLFTAGVLYFVVVNTLISGAAAASFVWVGGIALEGIFVIFYLRYIFGDIGRAAEEIPDRGRGTPDVGRALRFFLPLGATKTLGQLVLPVINAGLARTAAPTIAIGAFAVGRELAMLLRAPVNMLHQAVIVYHGRSRESNTTIFRFCLAGGLFFAAGLWLTVTSPAVYWLLEVVIDLPETMMTAAITALAVLAVWPLILALREFYWGVLMERRDTLMIAIARTANLLGAAAALVIGILGPWFSPETGLHPAALGSFAFVTGELMETIVVGIYVRMHRDDTAADTQEKQTVETEDPERPSHREQHGAD